MSFLGTQKIKKPPAPPTTASPEVQQAQLEQRRRALLAKGRQSTILSQPMGLGTVGQAAT